MSDSTENKDFREGRLLLIDKPLEWTSFDVVNKVKRTLNYKLPKSERIKVGHAGTLDPLATGLLIVATGKFTKKLHQLQGLDKSYSGSIKLGATTPSYDCETEENEHYSTEHLTVKEILSAAQSLTGSIQQVPPLYSAVRIDGERAYKKARRQENDKLPDPRNVIIHAFDIICNDFNNITFNVNCSKGTYIRSLAFDLGQKLNNGAYLTSLRRTSIGDFNIENASNLEEIVEELKAYNNECLSRLG